MILSGVLASSPERVVDDLLEGMLSLDWTAADAPGLWPYFLVDDNNPYQRLLYSRLATRNLQPVPSYRMTLVDPVLESTPAGVPVAVHVHWLNTVLQRAASDADARQATDRFLSLVEGWQRRGARVVWTVHNVLPHEAAFPDREAELCQRFADQVDLVHVMGAETVEAVAPHYTLPADRTYVLPHPSYVGAYPDWVSRDAARAALGLPRHAHVLVTLGQVRPYKGHQAFLDAFDAALRDDPDLWWVVAGKLVESAETEEFVRRVATHPRVVFHPGPVPDAQVQHFLRAADIAALPYLRSLNSGALMLALSFDLPVVSSQAAGTVAAVPEAARVLHEPGDHEGLVRAIEASRGLAGDEPRAHVRRAALALAPGVVGQRWADDMRGWLDSGRPPQG